MTHLREFSTMLSAPGWSRLQRVAASVAGGVAIALSLWVSPGLADPFRSTNARSIDDQTEQAFDQIFKQGNYRAAEETLKSVSASEPLAYAMATSLAYLAGDMESMSQNATRTREAAEQLVDSDPLRGNLYIAAGLFLEGAYTLSTEGIVAATPSVLSKLQQVFDHLNQAEKIDPTDPELNLIRGFMDLMLAVNLPFASPDQAIARLENYAGPSYLADRGIAIGYRDLGQPDKALQAVDQALQTTPENPDLYYLKAQILVRQGQEQASLEFFQKAIDQQAQLPQALANQIAYEQCRTTNRVNSTNQSCVGLLDRGE
jgi:tetratricopeptide (TPR) repeat protein